MYKAPHELDWTNCTFVIDMLNYTWTVSSLSELTAQLRASRRPARHTSLWMSFTFVKGSPVRRPEVTKRVTYIWRNTKETGEMSVSWNVSFWKKGSSNFLIPVYIVHLRSRNLSLIQGNWIKLSCTCLKSESNPKTLNLWSISPYKNTIKCLWMPFFLYIFAINMEKVYPNVQVRKPNIILMYEGRGRYLFFCTNYRNSSNEKASSSTPQPPQTLNRIDLVWNGKYRNASRVYKNEHIQTLATTSLLLSCLDASLCPWHDFVASL